MAEIQPNWENIYKPQANFMPQGNPALDMLRQRYSQHIQERANNIKDFTGELAKLNFNGAKDSDLPELQNDYSNILQQFQKYRAENDPKKQAELNLQMRQAQNQFLYKAQVSKNENEEFHKANSLVHNPNVELDNSAYGDLKEWATTSSFDKKLQAIKDRQQNWIIPKSDPMKDAQEIAKGLMKTETTDSQRYNSNTGQIENVSSTEQSVDHDNFMNTWIATHSNDPNKVKSAIKLTGEQDPVKAVVALGEKMYPGVTGGKSVEKVTNAGLTLENREKLLREGASFRAQFSPGQQQTPFSRTGDYIQNLGKIDPEKAVSVVKSLLGQIDKKGLQGDFRVGINNGTLAIDFPERQTGARTWVDPEPVRIDLADPNFNATLQAKMHQHGLDINGFNQNYKGKAVQTAQPKEDKQGLGYQHKTKGKLEPGSWNNLGK